MTRTSNKDKAIAYAVERGIILTVEDRDNFDGDYAVEVWSLVSHLSEPNSYCHTYFARSNTEPRAWADALAYMQRLTECPADCSCRDQDQDNANADYLAYGTTEAQVWISGDHQDQDQDQDQDTDQDTDQDRPIVNVWVCECCALLITNGDDSGCRDFHNHTHPDSDPAVRHLTGLNLRVGYFTMNCNGCGMILRDGADVYGAIRLTN